MAEIPEQEILNFLSVIPGATHEHARAILEMVDGDLERAINLQLQGYDTQSGSQAALLDDATSLAASAIQAESPSQSRQPRARQSTTGDLDGVDPQHAITIESDIESDTDMLDYRELADPDDAQDPTVNDAEVAMRLQQEYNHNRFHPNDYLQALTSQSNTFQPTNSLMHSDQSTINAILDPSSSTSRFVEQQFSTSRLGTLASSTVPLEIGALRGKDRPPDNLISAITLDKAKERGKRENKWILVNVQNYAEFACQMLNHDVWNNDFVQGIVESDYIFLQYTNTDIRHQEYTNFYFQDKVNDLKNYPHIAILDPRTGEQLETWTGREEIINSAVNFAERFASDLANFAQSYSVNGNERNAPPRRVGNSLQADALYPTSLSEEDQVKLALERSLHPAYSGDPISNGSLMSNYDSEAKGYGSDRKQDSDSDSEQANGPAREQPQALSLFRLIPSDRPHNEPPNDALKTTRIQFRHANGRFVRRFKLDDHVSSLFEWLKADTETQLLKDQVGREFDLLFCGRNLIDVLDNTIQEAGLRNATVHIEFTELDV